jgi:hypothetical protein
LTAAREAVSIQPHAADLERRRHVAVAAPKVTLTTGAVDLFAIGRLDDAAICTDAGRDADGDLVTGPDRPLAPVGVVLD